ncbi:hypothetical protein BLOT_001726 [Blomia tropicalis]|nr:hypothetical protein BLOT_001726 [Blomia tropicalis]
MEFIPKSLRTMWIKGSKRRLRLNPLQCMASMYPMQKHWWATRGLKDPSSSTSLKVLILPKKNDFDLRFSGLLKNYTADLLSFSLFEKSTKFPIYNCIKSIRLLFDLTLTGGYK